jgi:hypothetical protein
MDTPKRRGRPPAPRTPAPDDAKAVTVRVIGPSFAGYDCMKLRTGAILDLTAADAALAIARGLVEAV